MCKLYFKSFLWINLFNSHNNHIRQKYNFSIHFTNDKNEA